MSNINKIILIAVIILASIFAIARLAQSPGGQLPVLGEAITGHCAVLDLSNQDLKALPASVLSKTNLTELDISHNQLTGALPSQIGQLKNLKKLDTSYNQLTGVPAEMGQLENLEYLDLSYNKLTGLPNELANLKNLKTLNLAGNNYSQQDLQIIQQKLTNTNFILK